MQQRIEAMGRYLQRIVPFGMTGAVLIAVAGEIVLNAGYGLANRKQGIKNSAETILSVGSITKQFTAACIMKLVEQGKLQPHDLLSRYLPDAPPDKQGITLHHLLTHTAGITNYTGADYVDATRTQAVTTALTTPLRHEPGGAFAYSNAGYTLLAAVVEVVSGKAYEQFLRDQLLLPAGMHHTGYSLPDWSTRTVAHWYVGQTDNLTPLDKPYPEWNLLGNGDILSCTHDLFHWYEALRDARVLTSDSLQTMFTPFRNNYAYGWRVEDGEYGRVISHNGASGYGSSATYHWFRDRDLLLVILCNSDYHGSVLATTVHNLLVPKLLGEATFDAPVTTHLLVDSLQQYIGDYVLPTGDRWEIVVMGERLLLKAYGQTAIQPLVFEQTDDLPDYSERNERIAGLFTGILADDETLLVLIQCGIVG